MRKFIEDVLSDTADLVLMLTDWLCDTLAPPLEFIGNILYMLDGFKMTYIIILCILVVMVVLT